MKTPNLFYLITSLLAGCLQASEMKDITLKIAQSDSRAWCAIATIDNASNTVLTFEADKDLKSRLSVLSDVRWDVRVAGKWREIVVFKCGTCSGDKFKVEPGGKGSALVLLIHINDRISLPAIIRLRLFEATSGKWLYSNEIVVRSETASAKPRGSGQTASSTSANHAKKPTHLVTSPITATTHANKKPTHGVPLLVPPSKPTTPTANAPSCAPSATPPPTAPVINKVEGTTETDPR